MAKKDKKDKSTTVEVTQAMAVRHRPRKPKDLLGQNHVVTQLKGMVKRKQFPSTLLITGQHGTGKTTTARIIANLVNCETLSACGKCDSCKIGNKHPDVHQLSMGVNGKVDEVRKMIAGSRNSPLFEKRIYILDEAHNLTGAAAEALLVPLEEPSQNTMWILCSNEPQKMKDTILSRCTRLDMKPIESDVIVKRLFEIAEMEGCSLKKQKGSQEAMELIADFTNGHFRDAISLLESVIYAVSSGEKMDSKTVLTSYVESSAENLDEMAVKVTAATLNHDLPAVIKFIRTSGNARGLMHKLRWLLDYLVAEGCGCANYTPYSGRLFNTLAKKKKIAYDLPTLLDFQSMLVDLEMKFNSTSIPEEVLMQSAMGNYLVAEYRVKHAADDSSDDSDDSPKKKKKKKKSKSKG